MNHSLFHGTANAQAQLTEMRGKATLLRVGWSAGLDEAATRQTKKAFFDQNIVTFGFWTIKCKYKIWLYCH
jgi:hypothetical protein